MTKRILINTASAHMGGSVTYLQNVLQELPEQLPQVRIRVYVPEATCEKLPTRESVEVRPYPYARTRGLQRLYFDQVEIPRVARRIGADVLFSATGFGTVWSPVPQVLLVRNMAYFDPRYEAKYRELGRSFIKTRLRRWHSLLSIRAADVVLFPTRAVRDVVGSYVSLGRAGTQVLHYGYDTSRFDVREGGGSSAGQDLREHVDGEGPLLLNVSTYAVHKNLETLIEAMATLQNAYPGLKLITTTSRDQTSDTAEYDALKERADELSVTDSWIELGYVPHRELPAVYEAADAYVFSSFTESFGHSMVEAMASGLPVIAADTAVHREVCGDAAAYFDTFDAADCAETIRGVLDHDGRRDEMTQASLCRAEHFSWERYTNQLAGLFRELICTGKMNTSVVSHGASQKRADDFPQSPSRS